MAARRREYPRVVARTSAHLMIATCVTSASAPRCRSRSRLDRQGHGDVRLLPDHDSWPPRTSEPAPCVFLPTPEGFQLEAPPVVVGPESVEAPRVAVPEATVREDRDARAQEDDISASPLVGAGRSGVDDEAEAPGGATRDVAPPQASSPGTPTLRRTSRRTSVDGGGAGGNTRPRRSSVHLRGVRLPTSTDERLRATAARAEVLRRQRRCPEQIRGQSVPQLPRDRDRTVTLV